MSGTVVVALPHTSGVTQAEAEKALIDLVERRVRESIVVIAEQSSTLSTWMRNLAMREIDGEESENLLAMIDRTIGMLQAKRLDITNRLEARASLIERVDGSPTLELARAG